MSEEEKYQNLSDIRRAAFDRYAEVVTITSSSLLTIMVTFMDHVTKDRNYIGWLILGWSLFAVCIILGSTYVLRDTKIATDGYKLVQDNPDIENVAPRKIFKFIQRILPWTFIGAILSLFIFAICNIWERL
jgi:hypothetical protein